jgi:hypothetical protein
MHKKNIRVKVKKQLKYNHPHWKNLKKKAKKKLLCVKLNPKHWERRNRDPRNLLLLPSGCKFHLIKA